MDYLSIGAIVKDENQYLPEWIEYHKLVGVERFHIYDNGSKQPIAQTLARDVASGLVVVTPFPGHAKQYEVYKDAVTRLKDRTFWLAVMDVDEFIVPKKVDDVRILLRDREQFGGMAMSWQTFGTSGHHCRPRGLQIEEFLYRGPDSFSWNQHIKTILRPTCVTGMDNSHAPLYKPGMYCVDTGGVRVDGPFHQKRRYDQIQLNHYFTRSRAEYMEKMARGSPDGRPKGMRHFDEVEQGCRAVKDEAILRFVPALRKAMMGRK